MTSTKKDPVLVVLQLSGGNDAVNTLIPYGDPRYADNRPTVRVSEEQVLPLNDYVGFNPSMAPLKELYDQGKVAVIQGVGYPNPNRSHFPLHGYLAHLRARQGGHGRLDRKGHSRTSTPTVKRPDRRQLRPRPPQVPGRAGRTRGLGRQPRDLRGIDRHPGR